MKRFFVLILVFSCSFVSQAQTEVSGVNLPNNETFGTHELVLNGAGVREKFWIDLYVGALYLSEKTSDINAVLEDDAPLAVRLHIVSGLITSKKMSDAVNEGFQKSTDGNTAPYTSKINKFLGFFSEKIEKNDVFDITYQPSIGVVAYKNNKELGVIEGNSFKKVLFGIWFSDQPVDKDLKEEMLGL